MVLIDFMLNRNYFKIFQKRNSPQDRIWESKYIPGFEPEHKKPLPRFYIDRISSRERMHTQNLQSKLKTSANSPDRPINKSSPNT